MESDIERVARELCRERCSYYGEPACWKVEPDIWPNPNCERDDASGCMNMARVAVATLRALAQIGQ